MTNKHKILLLTLGLILFFAPYVYSQAQPFIAYLRQLKDVNTTGAADGDVLTYDSGTSKWVAEAGGAGGGGGWTDGTNVVYTTTSSDNVGVGISAPLGRLHITSAAGVDGLTPTNLIINSTSASNAWTPSAEYASLQFASDDGSHEVRAKVSAFVENVSGTQTGLSFWTGAFGVTPTEKMRITNGGNVGIGTTVPVGRLEVAGSTNNVLATNFIGSTSISGINLDTTNNNFFSLVFRTLDTNGTLGTAAKISGINRSHAPGAISGDLSFLTTNAGTVTEAMRIMSTGSVGIGTSNPISQLHIGGATGGIVNINREDTSIATNDILGEIRFDGDDAVSTVDASVVIRAYSGTNHASTNKGGYLDILTKDNTNNSSGVATSRLRVFNNGNVGIGNGITPETLLEVQGGEGLDASLTLDADDGDDSADTWIIESDALLNDLYFTNHATTNVTFTDNGLVGIGRTNPVSELMVVSGPGSTLTVGRLETGLTNAQLVGSMAWWNNDSSLTTQNQFARIDVYAAQNIASDAAAGNMAFFTTSNTSGGSPIERMRITSTGNVGIGSSVPLYKLEVNGSANVGGSTLGDSLTISSPSTATVRLAQTNKGSLGHFLEIMGGGWSGDAVKIGSGSTPWMTLINTNVGIGTSVPATKLDIVGSASVIRMQDSDTGDVWNTQNDGGTMEFTNTTDGVTVVSIGSVNNRLSVTPDGTAPLYANDIEVRSSGVNNATLLLGATGTGVAGFCFDGSNGDCSGGDYGYLNQLNDLSVELGVASSNTLTLETSGTARVTILGGGNVGIGSDSPAQRLDVAGNIATTGTLILDSTPNSDLTASGIESTVTVDANATGVGALFYRASDGNFEEADADAASTMIVSAIALETGTGPKRVLLSGYIRNDAWNWTPGALLYASTTAGAITATAPSGAADIVQIIGIAVSADIIYFNPDYTYIEI